MLSETLISLFERDFIFISQSLTFGKQKGTFLIRRGIWLCI